MIEKAHIKWIQLGNRFSKNEQYLEKVWQELIKQYSKKNRHYHGLPHIWNMLLQSEESKGDLFDKDVVDFAIWFHDIIYKATRKDNEEKSAEFAKRILRQFSFEETRVEKVYNLIVSTQKHQIIDPSNRDNAYLLDFDLSILGQPWNVYEIYIQNIRKEYKIYPNLLYKPGRKKVLETFLERKTLYFTEKYQEWYEQKARENLKKEIQLLS